MTQMDKSGKEDFSSNQTNVNIIITGSTKQIDELGNR